MKNIIGFTSVEECRAYLESLWATDLFRESKWVGDYVDRVAKVMPVFYDMTFEARERAHFTTWFRAIAHREYDNKYIQDLYYLHEYVHLATLTYDHEADWTDWYTKMVRNEMEASLASEAYVYFRLTDLREKTFPHKIWADRFKFERYTKQDRVVIGNNILQSVRETRIRNTQAPSPFDYLELQIASYAKQNQEWSRIWAGKWRQVERHILELDELPASERAANHIAWLKKNMGAWYNIPFESEATKFQEVYEENKRRYGNYLAET